ncbi:hypothetical protein RVR_10566 [Actinacidiphila reveromycinica]|uniref:C1q domain-containing protein n=1 Tax=Actinacidiphila reveromycinica TaxID=659352 RepID=A0A7U3UXQ1_9ACTN|nr:hypothetical protein [Streptomyces sp. SN-593]BBB00567.1 hypothetical protein RVR_7695 [Streptomyces sp. SN-593]BBB00620.1 hypothetical protein RVR_10566 [Streptomyces sp. SN-593]
MEWAFTTGPPRFSGYCNAYTGGSPAGTLASSTSYTSIPLDSELFDSAGGHNNTTNPDRYVVMVPGTYHVTASGGFSANATGNRSVRIGVNGGAAIPSGQIATAGMSGNTWYGNVSALVALNAGDYLSVQMWQNSGTALALSTGATGGPSLFALWVSP